MQETKMVFETMPDHYDSVLILLETESGLIYVNNKKRGWELTGGKTDNGETYQETAVREAYEEAGAIVNPNNIEYIGYYTLRDGHQTLVVKSSVDELDEIPSSSETTERLISAEPMPKEQLSFPDDVYDRIFEYIGWPKYTN